MRVGIASEWIGAQVGGLERQSADLIRSLARLDGDDRYVAFVTARGARTLGALEGGRTRIRQTTFSSRWYYVPFGLPIGLLRYPVDLLHATFTVVPWCPVKRIVLTVHDVCPDVHPEFFPSGVRARFRWLLRQGIARAARILVPSDATRRELLQHYPADASKIVVVPNGVRAAMEDEPDPSAATDEFDERTWPSDFALYVGRFHARKNLERLVEAFARSKARRSGLRLVLAGRDLWDRDRVLARIAALGLEREVICPGHVSDATLGHLYRRARLFAFPSMHEGFGIPPVEAMRYGVPVLACRTSAMPEVLGEAACYTDPHDTDQMAADFDRLASDGRLRAELVARGYERARRYAWPNVARATRRIYHQAAGTA